MLYDVSARARGRTRSSTRSTSRARSCRRCARPVRRSGAVTARAAAATGIPEGTPVFAGGADTESALLGSGVVEVGQTGAVLGTTTPVQQVLRRAGARPGRQPVDELPRRPGALGAREQRRRHRQHVPLAARPALRRRRRRRARRAPEAAMAAVDPGRGRSSCHLGPAIFNLRDMNPFQPAGPPVPLPAPAHRPAESRRAAARLLRERRLRHPRQLRADRAVSGHCRPTALWVSGGMTRSPTLLRLVATTLGRAARRWRRCPRARASAAPILAAVGAGLHPELPDGGGGDGADARRGARPGVAPARSRSATAAGARSTRPCRAGPFEPHPRARHAGGDGIRGVCFDLDGTLADTEPLQWEAYRRVLGAVRRRRRPRGVSAALDRRRGRAPSGRCRTLRAADRRRRAARAQGGGLPRAHRGGRRRRCPGRARCLERLARTLPARASSPTSSRAEADDACSSRSASRGSLDAVVTREDYAAAEAGARRLPRGRRGARARRPRRAWSVEDTPRGLRAALAAGMRVVAVPSELTHDNDFTGAARRLAGLDALTPELLQDCREVTVPAVPARPMIEVRDVAKRFGAVEAVRGDLASRSARARSSGSSARTAPARRRRCACWPASSRPRRARCASPGTTRRASRSPAGAPSATSRSTRRTIPSCSVRGYLALRRAR